MYSSMYKNLGYKESNLKNHINFQLSSSDIFCNVSGLLQNSQSDEYRENMLFTTTSLNIMLDIPFLQWLCFSVYSHLCQWNISLFVFDSPCFAVQSVYGFTHTINVLAFVNPAFVSHDHSAHYRSVWLLSLWILGHRLCWAVPIQHSHFPHSYYTALFHYSGSFVMVAFSWWAADFALIFGYQF